MIARLAGAARPGPAQHGHAADSASRCVGGEVHNNLLGLSYALSCLYRAGVPWISWARWRGTAGQARSSSERSAWRSRRRNLASWQIERGRRGARHPRSAQQARMRSVRNVYQHNGKDVNFSLTCKCPLACTPIGCGMAGAEGVSATPISPGCGPAWCSWFCMNVTAKAMKVQTS